MLLQLPLQPPIPLACVSSIATRPNGIAASARQLYGGCWLSCTGQVRGGAMMDCMAMQSEMGMGSALKCHASLFTGVWCMPRSPNVQASTVYCLYLVHDLLRMWRVFTVPLSSTASCHNHKHNIDWWGVTTQSDRIGASDGWH